MNNEEPVKCRCGRKAKIMDCKGVDKEGYRWGARVICDREVRSVKGENMLCRVGPWKPTEQEAIRAWDEENEVMGGKDDK